MTAGLDVLPPHVRAHLDAWAEGLRAALGDDLVGVLVHGGVVRGEYRPGESDVDAIVVLRRASFANLGAVTAPTQKARYAARVQAMFLVEDEIAGASDCFPLLYDDIKRHHALLTGRDPFAGVEVRDTYLRLRIEQELRDVQIRLRRSVIDAGGAREAALGGLKRSASRLRSPMHALLALRGVACAPDLASVAAKAGEIYGVDVGPLTAADREPEPAHAALEALLAAAIRDVDAMKLTG